MKKCTFSWMVAAFCSIATIQAQHPFYFGADLSYVNEMEHCGVAYKEQGQVKDVYQIFADHHANLIRLRLWNNPAWYDTLNDGQRFSNFQDVRNSISRAKSKGMDVLLDFQLSDIWADPSRQLVPKAWEGVVNDLPALKDSVYNFISNTLLELDAEGLLPEMVQIGNETNKGILLAPAVDAAGWSLDWNRNSQLFNRAIQAVREVESTTGKQIKVALHIAGPANAGWLMEGFWNNGVTDFDVIGLSYYWAWHKPTSIADVGNVVAALRQTYPGKAVMIFETGYAWTNQWKDNASNIINEINPGYAPASPENQGKWLIDLTQEMINKGASGVIYWEPAWQSSSCWTLWGQGSHQEHATFFDFQNNLLNNGGIGFMSHNYENLLGTHSVANFPGLNVWVDLSQSNLNLHLNGFSSNKPLKMNLINSQGGLVASKEFAGNIGTEVQFPIPILPAGIYFCTVYEGGVFKAICSVALGK